MSQLTRLPGSRYVFFNSLTGPLRNFGDSVISSISSKLSQTKTTDNSIDIHINNIEKYLKFIKSMAESAQSNEIKFLESSINQLENNDPIREHLEAFNKNENFNYIQFIALLNELLQSSKDDLKIFEEQLIRMQEMKEHMKQFSSATQEKLEELYNSDHMRQYRGILFSKGENISKNFEDSYASIMAKKINQVLRSIATSPELKEQIILLYNDNLEISEDNFKQILINLVVDTVLNEDINTSVENLSSNVIKLLHNDFSNILNNITKDYISAAESTTESLEEIAIRGTQSLGNYIINLDINTINKIKDRYGNKELNNNLDLLIKLSKSKSKDDKELNKIKRKVSSLLKAQILEKNALARELAQKKLSHAKFIQAIKNQPDFITPIRLKDNLLKSIKGIKLSHDSLAEIITEKDVQEKIVSVIVSNIPGKSITFKADVRFSTGYIDEHSTNLINTNSIKNAINNTLKDFYSDFFLIYQDKSKGQTDIKLAQAAYQEWIQEMQENIKKIIELDNTIINKEEAIHQAYKAFEKTFSLSVSVKDYDLYNNVLGFHGGSLGSKSSPQKVMENIYAMYELGGITKLDVDALMTAVINCGNAMIGHSLRPALENYLLGGAALIMFDDSFALSDEFLKSMTTQLKGQTVVNIYRLNTRYVPASFILNEIYNNLISIYSNIQNNLPTKNKGNNKVTITNNIDESIIDNYNDFPPLIQWNLVRNETEESILIQFSFMAGLLDILQNLPQAFNNV